MPFTSSSQTRTICVSGEGNARVMGNSIALRKGYYEYRNGNPRSNADKQSIFLHEAIHIVQGSKYGTGGTTVRFFDYTDDPNPLSCNNSLRSTPCSLTEQAIEDYDGNGGRINALEVEAEIEQIRGVNSIYWWSTIPVF